MSHHFVSVKSLPAGGESFSPASAPAWTRLLPFIGGAGAVLSIILFLMGDKISFSAQGVDGHDLHYTALGTYAYSWLFAFFVCFTIACGGVFWCILHNVSNSGWGVAIRRLAEVLANMIPVVAICGLPLLLSAFCSVIFKTEHGAAHSLWGWMKEHAESTGATTQENLPHLLHLKYPYMNLGWNGALPGWLPRFVIYFAALGLIARFLLKSSVSQDTTGDVKTTLKVRFHSSWFVIIFALCVTFAATDWIKGLNYTWASTMFGVNVFAGCALSSMAFLIIVVTTLKDLGYLKHIVTPEHTHLMGKLMLAFTIFWAYIAFSQYFLIWYANIAEETQFYAIRNTGGWNVYSILMVACHFFIPFVCLLPQAWKKNYRRIRKIAFFVLCVHIMELYWFIIPERGPKLADRATIGWAVLFDVIALVTVGSIFLWAFIRLLSKQSLYPCGDPRLQESINVVN